MAAQTRADVRTAPGPMEPVPYRVADHHRETADTSTLVLERADGRGATFKPGQFTMLYAFGIGEAPISISGQINGRGVLVHTVREVGAVTRAIATAQPGTVLGVRGPYGVGWPVEETFGRDVVIVAGGLGMAPLRPTVYHVLANRESRGRATLLYGARTPADILYPEQLETWRRERQIDVELTVDSATPTWRGRVGVVPKLVAQAGFDPDNCVAFVCGPEVMMRFTAAALLDAGVAAEQIYVSLERHMECGVGHCGRCQLGPTLICRDGPVYRYADVARWLSVREL